MNTAKPELEVPASPIQYVRDEDFLYRYANNAQFEPTVWDLKITFGQTETRIGPNAVIQHTAITIPWAYVKLLSYFLQAQLVSKEAEDGKITVPKGIIPPPPEQLPKEVESRLKHPKEALEAIRRMYDDFLAANPEAKA